MHEDDAFSFSGSGALSDAAMMSEEEAQAIVQNYNTTIQQLAKENDNLQTKLEDLVQIEMEEEKKLAMAKQKYEQQTQRMEKLKKKQQELNYEKEQLFSTPQLQAQWKNNKEVMNQLMAFLTNGQSKGQITQIPDIKSLMQFDSKDELDPHNTQKSGALIELSQESKQQQEIQKELTSKILQAILKYSHIQMQKGAKKECQQCHLQYNPRTNQIDSCLFHNGKQKFYSCKKCGADDYYTCCNKCIRCSEGCKTNFHQPKQ